MNQRSMMFRKLDQMIGKLENISRQLEVIADGEIQVHKKKKGGTEKGAAGKKKEKEKVKDVFPFNIGR